MRSIYVLRHSARDNGGAHLNAAGVQLARAIGDRLGPMQCTASSPALRCLETAVALGCAVDEEWDELALPDDDELMLELDRIATYADAVRLVQHGRRIPELASQLSERIHRLIDELQDHQDALLVTHAGVVEVAAAAVCGGSVAELGEGVGYCEGVRMMLHDADAMRDSSELVERSSDGRRSPRRRGWEWRASRIPSVRP